MVVPSPEGWEAPVAAGSPVEPDPVACWDVAQPQSEAISKTLSSTDTIRFIFYPSVDCIIFTADREGQLCSESCWGESPSPDRCRRMR